ncbi:MAG: site-2 protease family protein [Anaerotignaceae bacterium]
MIILLIQAVCVIIATTIHEFTRAVVSTVLGDKKPKSEGRLTLNPIKHFEPIGFILALTTGFGWGKPVQTNPMFYKNRKSDTLITAIAPSVVNLLVGVVVCVFISRVSRNSLAYSMLYYLAYVNVGLAVYNIVPVTPMDGLKVMSALVPSNTYFSYIQHEKVIQMVFLLLLFMGIPNSFFNSIIGMLLKLFGL